MLTLLLAITTGGWTLIGPPGEFANTVAADPIRPGVVYAGTGTGVFMSEDAGGSWRPVISPPLCSNVVEVAVDQEVTQAVYAATFTHNCIATGGDGLFRSEDGGETWSTIELGHPILPFGTVSGVAGRLYVSSKSCSLENGFFVNCTGQLLRSDDFGTTFEPSFAGLPNSDLISLDIDRNDPLRLLGTAGGVFQSDDGGQTWTQIRNLDGIPERAALREIAIDPDNRETLLLSTDTATFRSTDGGAHWVESSPSGLLVNQLLFDRSLPGIVYGVTNDDDIFRSLDDGTSWAPFDAGLDGVHIVYRLSEGIDARGAETLYAATGQGVFAIGIGRPTFPVTTPSPVLVHGRE
jgi:photosystem II stability/assembly factor-like uncharacterized protein